MDRLDLVSDNCIPVLKNALSEHEVKTVTFDNALNVLHYEQVRTPYRYSIIDRNFAMKQYVESYEKLFSPDLIIASDCTVAFADLKTPVISIAQNLFTKMGERLKTVDPSIVYEMNVYDHIMRMQLKKSKAVAITRQMRSVLGDPSIPVIEIGVDTEFFSPSKVEGTGKRGLWVGKFSPRYNFEFVSQLAKDFPDVRWTVIFEHGMDKTPRLPNVDIASPNGTEGFKKILSTTDFMVSTNGVENYGYSLLLAASSDIPVIAPKSGWFWDVASYHNEIGEVMLRMEYGEYKAAVETVLRGEHEYKPREVVLKEGVGVDEFKEKWRHLIKEHLNI